MDSSTQSTKIELRETDSGALIASSSSRHPITSPPCSEQDPNAWWSALAEAFAQLGDHRQSVTAISVAAQQHGLVVLDKYDNVIRPAKLWNDTESAPEAAALLNQLDPASWAKACGSVPLAAFTITKLAWLANHEPQNFCRIHRIMLPHDYLTWRLTGAHVTDRGDVSGTGWWDPISGQYRPDLLNLINGADWTEKLPKILNPTESAGELSSGSANELGLLPGIVVGPGTGDNMAAALGLGLKPGDIVMSFGTSGTVYTVSLVPSSDSSGSVAGFASADGKYLPLVCTLNATRVTDTIASWLSLDRDDMAVAALNAPVGANGVTLVGHLDGERTPNRPDATGTFIGLRNSTSKADLARAAYEGVVCGLLSGLDALADANIDTSGMLHVIGGGARSPAYQQITAELRGRPILVPNVIETVATGAAVQATAVLTGEDTSEISNRWLLGTGITVEPNFPEHGKSVRFAYHQALLHTA